MAAILLQSGPDAGAQPRLTIRDGTHLATISSLDSFGYWSVDFYMRPDYERPEPGDRFQSLFFAQFSRGEDSDGLRREVQWADSRSCPKIFGVLEAISRLEAPRFDFGNLYGSPPLGAETPPPKPVPTDATGAQIQGRARQSDGSMSSMTVSDAQGPVTAVVLFSARQLESCWSETPPSFIER